MKYRKITPEVVVKEEDSETFTQALNDAMGLLNRGGQGGNSAERPSSSTRGLGRALPPNAGEISVFEVVRPAAPGWRLHRHRNPFLFRT
jgi:hypothetical protein